MPIAAYTEISLKWNLGSLICDIWTSFDVLCCTASILHLVAIALDRYWAITNVEYATKRTVKRILTMIIIIWSISTVVGISPHIFGLSSSLSGKSDLCRLTDNLTFQLASTFAAFYLPLIFMCVIYWKIFQSAKFRIRKKVFNNNNNNTRKNKNSSKIGKKKQSEIVKNESLLSRRTSTEPEQKQLDTQITKINNETEKPIQLDLIKENSVACFHPKTSEIQTSDLKDNYQIINKNNNNNDDDNKLRILKRSKRFKSDKLKQIKNLLKQADHMNESLEMLKANQICANNNNNNNNNDMNLTDTDITKIKLSDSDNLISSCINEINKTNEIKKENTVNEFKNSNHNEDNNAIVTTKQKQEVKQTTQNTVLIKHEINQQQQPQEIKNRDSKVSMLIKKRAKIDIKRERKAARVLGIIMSCFIICWLPYFCMQIFIAICKDCYFSLLLEQYHIGTILTWSGYLNSLLNPIIYTIFSPDFRNSFAKILFGKYARKNVFKI
jgi:hypothetical protein